VKQKCFMEYQDKENEDNEEEEQEAEAKKYKRVVNYEISNIIHSTE